MSPENRDNIGVPAVPAIVRRFSADGRELPTLGVLVDLVDEPLIERMTAATVHLDGELISLLEGTLGDEWHLLIMERTQRLVSSLSMVNLMFHLGIQQIVAATSSRFDPRRFDHVFGPSNRAAEFLDLAGAPPLVGSVAQDGCPRLDGALMSVAARNDVELLDPQVRLLINSGLDEERNEAQSRGMCFAGVDLMQPSPDDLELHIGRLISQIPDAISPASSCTCASRRTR